MGQTLSSPATGKESESGGNTRFSYGLSAMQGWRISMEDAHTAVLDLDEGSDNPNAFFAVYDGHGGGTIAKFAGQHLHKRLVSEESYQQKQYDTALKKSFLGTDEDLLADPAHTRDPSGCTAVAALVTHDGKIYVANAGDSRSVISVKGEVKLLSFDHKPTNKEEMERICGAGGYVEYGRVNGNLALSRALGDFDFKKNYSLPPTKQIITADPDVSCHEISEEDEFFIIACDGIWDCLTSQQAVDFVRRQVAEGKELSEICEIICEHCLAPDTSSGPGVGCDNMTILIVAILHGRTKEEWYAWVTARVNKQHGYPTPVCPPQLYAPSRLMAFRARKERQEMQARQAKNEPKVEAPDLLDTPLARALIASGMLIRPGYEHVEPEDAETKRLTEEFRQYMREDSGHNEYDNSDQNEYDESDESDEPDGPLQEAPPPPSPLSNGNVSTPPIEQLKLEPHGDEPLPVVKAEGMIDSSEDPLLKT